MAKGSGCKFLYGPETSETEALKISEALVEKRELKTELQLYRKNGSMFWCLLDIVPIKNEKRDVVLFLVSHKDITKDKTIKESKFSEDGQDSPSKNSGSDGSADEDKENESSGAGEAMPDNYDYGRRRSRAVLYHISGQLNKPNKTKSKLQHLNMIASQMPEYKVQEVKKSRFIIVHYGFFKIGWDWLILLCTFYIAFMVPFNAAFMNSGRFKDFIYLDAIVEVLFALDIFLNFRTTFLNKSGQVVYESRTIAVNYIKGWFLLDLLAAIPFDLLYAFSVETATMVHLLKVARLLRLARLLQKFERYNQYSILVLALLLCMFALIAHWLACIWYAIGKAELDAGGVNWTVGWLYELSERLDRVIFNKTVNIPDTMTSYITALYFTCSSLTSVGFGNVSANTNVEKIFSVCAMLLGAIMHAVVFGNVTTIIQRMYARRAIFHSKTKDLKDFFRIHRFPRPLKNRMRDYFQAMWSINNGIDFKEIVKDFPEDMRGEIGLHLHREILSLPIFQLAPPGCLKTVSLQTERFVCGPGEFIMRKGDTVNYLYYVCSGSLEVLKDDQVVAILGKGDIFGTDLDYDDPVSVSGCDVRSLAYCELLCIQVKGLVQSLLLYPDYADTFNTELPNDLTYNVREGHEDPSDDESSMAAPVITLPSISEDEEENEDNNNDLDLTSKERLKEIEEESSDVKGVSPLFTQLGRDHGNVSTGDWSSGRGQLPNGHIGSALSMRLASHQTKLKQWINRARRRDDGLAVPSITPTISTSAGSAHPHQSATHFPARQKPGSSTMSSLALRRTASGNSRLMHRRARDKLRSSRNLPTLSSVASERTVEQVMVHTLQMELEGTRDSVIGLERRLDDLHDDLSSISRNVDCLLRLVSQSSCQSNLFLANNTSPSPNPNMNPTPSFYFSQSSDNDVRDSISLQSTSPAPDIWSLSGTHHKNDQHLNPFQASKGGLGITSPMVSPRVNFSPSPRSGYFPSFLRQGSLSNIKSDRIPAAQTVPDLRGEKSESNSFLHSLGASSRNKMISPLLPPPTAISQISLTSNEISAVTTKVSDVGVSSLMMKDRLQRPSNLSPLQPRRAKSLFAKPSKSPFLSTLRKNEEMAISATMASSSMGINPTPPEHHSMSSLPFDSTDSFQNDNYNLTQLEPCDAKLGHCDKADNLRLSYLETSSLSSPSPAFDLSTPDQLLDKQTSSDSDLAASRDHSFNESSYSKSKQNEKSGSPKQNSLVSSDSSPSSTSKKNEIKNSPQSTERTNKSLSPNVSHLTLEVSPTVLYPFKLPSPKSKWLKNLSETFKRSRHSPQSASSCSPEDIEFIDCDPFPEHLRLCPSNNYSSSLSQLPDLTVASYPLDSKRSRSSSTSSLSTQSVRKSSAGRTTKGINSADRERLIAPLSKAESFSDLQEFSEV